MTGPEHYAEAEKRLEASEWQRQKWGERDGKKEDMMAASWELQMAHVHATLALAAATAIRPHRRHAGSRLRRMDAHSRRHLARLLIPGAGTALNHPRQKGHRWSGRTGKAMA